MNLTILGKMVTGLLAVIGGSMIAFHTLTLVGNVFAAWLR